MKVSTFLDKPFNFLATSRTKWFYILSATIFIHFFLLLFQPFGIFNILKNPDNSVLDKFLFFFTITLLCFVSLVISQFFIRKSFNLKRLNYRTYGIYFLVECFVLFSFFFVQFFILSDFENRHEMALRIPFQIQNFFRVVLILLFPLSISVIYEFIKQLQEEVQEMSSQLKVYKTNFQKKHVKEIFEIVDENNQPQLKLGIDDFLYAESSNQYVLIYYLKEGKVEREIVRNRLKNILTKNTFTAVKQCHRSFVINLVNVEHLEQKDKKHFLVFSKNETIRVPVSKTYLEAILQEIEK